MNLRKSWIRDAPAFLRLYLDSEGMDEDMRLTIQQLEIYVLDLAKEVKELRKTNKRLVSENSRLTEQNQDYMDELVKVGDYDNDD